MRDVDLRRWADSLRLSHSVSRRDLVGDRLLPACLGLQEFLPSAGELVIGASSPEVTFGVNPMDLDDLVSDRPQEGTIVGGNHIAERGRPEETLQPHDPRHIEVIGRLIEQQQIGPAGQLAGQGEPFAPPAG